MYHCLGCNNDFTHTAVWHTKEITINYNGERAENGDFIERHTCPYCNGCNYVEIKLEKARIVSVKTVDINQVDEFLMQGYEVHELYAKNAILIKRQTTLELAIAGTGTEKMVKDILEATTTPPQTISRKEGLPQ